mgnify:CR=1 FL=1
MTQDNEEDTEVPVYLSDIETLKKREPQLYEAFNVICRYSTLGEWLVDTAEHNGLGFIISDSEENCAGVYDPGSKLVEIPKTNAPEENTGGVLPHEIMHSLQGAFLWMSFAIIDIILFLGYCVANNGVM